ncbi:hypothetical protein BB561_001601 [Smittium simulii]|uniref:Uncharacterized protein n=1 Tax=Smittium simulii TaxID=133385 RepID=A0A2T9YTV0_9FUNG|nr:hypothetical protein BB561_001601 [Smittium simulii]
MSNVPGVIPSAAAGVPLIPTKRTRLEYSTVAKTGYIDPATKNDYNFNFPAKNNQNNQNNQGCSRWAAIRAETIDKFIPRLYKLAIDDNNQPLMQAKMQLVGKLLGGESKKSLLQLRKEKESNVPLSMELETAKFMDGIRVARTLILDGIKCSPTPLNRCPVGMESLEGRRGVG